MTTGQTNRPAAAGQRLGLPPAGLRLRLGSFRRRARNAAKAAAIAANPDMPVPAAAISVHPESPPELGATAKMVVVTEGPAEAGLFTCPAPGVTPMEGDSGPAIAAEGALVPAVVVIVTVTVAAAPGEPAAPREPATPAFGVAVPVVSDGE